MTLSDSFSALILGAGIRLSAAQLAQFTAYLTLLQDWSQRMNLVGDASAATIEQRHFVESIALGAALREREILRPNARVIDVGAGAGFPGAVLKIVWPGIQLTLLEATAKKAAFLSALVEELTLIDTMVVLSRAEEAAHDPALRSQFDLVVARAVAPAPTLLEFTLPFARVGGHVATPKGSRVELEIQASGNALTELGAGRHSLLRLDVEGPAQRIFVVAKAHPTPNTYPRRPGLPRKQPL